MKYIVFVFIIALSNNIQAQGVWDMSKLNAAPAFRWINADTAKVRQLIFESMPFGDLPATDVFAYYATPGSLNGNTTDDKNLPIVILVHGGGGKAYKEWVTLWAKRGYAALAMDLAGNGIDGKKLPKGGPDQSAAAKFLAIDSALNKQWVYHSVANVILAHSLVRSFKEVDAERSAITGISWGGFLTCIVAGLDSRFKAAVPVYGCGFIYDNDGHFYRNFAKLKSKDKWIRQYDPSNYISKAKIPFLWLTGAQDVFFQPSIFSKTYNLVRKNSIFRILSTMPHSQSAGSTPVEIGVFIDHYLQPGKPNLPVFKKITVSGDLVTAEVQSASKILTATINYTTANTIPFKDRVWKVTAATVNGNIISAQMPPPETTIWMLNLKDAAGNIMSSEYMFPQHK